MTTAEAPAPEASSSRQAADGAPLEYRSVHTLAVLGLLVGLVSAVVLTTAGSSFESTLLLAPVPAVGLVVSLAAWRAIAASPDLYTGKPLAQAGAALSAAFLLLGLGWSGYVYATEVPDGYARVTFIDMKPSETDLVDRKAVPDDVASLIRDGDKVFIKGYIRPDSTRFTQNIKEFLLVRDNQQCCFGDLSSVQYFDQVQVELGTGLTTDYHQGLFRLGGVLRVAPGDPSLGTPLTYRLEADYVRP